LTLVSIFTTKQALNVYGVLNFLQEKFDNKSVWVYNVCIVIDKELVMRSYTFSMTIRSYVTVEADNIDEAYEKLEDIDPVGGNADVTYDDEWTYEYATDETGNDITEEA
jgi:hypothetical protein